MLSRYLLAFPAFVAFAACSSPVAQNDETGACAQTGEFANNGCAEIIGIVRGTQQQPLAGIVVGPVYLPGRGVFNTSYDETDSDGRFEFRVYRFSPPQTSLDTVSMYVRAADPQSAGVGVPARLRDSVLVTVAVTPVGRVPDPTTVAISLRTP